MSQDPQNDLPVTPGDQEPKAGTSTVPIWLVVLMTVLAYRGCIYVDQAGGFQAKVYPPYHEPPPVISGVEDPREKGRKIYAATCMPCHQPNGLGLPSQFPPLAGSEWVEAEGVNRIARFILSGLQGPITVKGVAFNGAMPAWKETLTKDEDVAAVLTYIRSEWGNKGGPVTAAEIKAIRAEEAPRATQWTADEGSKLPVK